MAGLLLTRRLPPREHLVAEQPWALPCSAWVTNVAASAQQGRGDGLLAFVECRRLWLRHPDGSEADLLEAPTMLYVLSRSASWEPTAVAPARVPGPGTRVLAELVNHGNRFVEPEILLSAQRTPELDSQAYEAAVARVLGQTLDSAEREARLQKPGRRARAFGEAPSRKAFLEEILGGARG